MQRPGFLSEEQAWPKKLQFLKIFVFSFKTFWWKWYNKISCWDIRTDCLNRLCQLTFPKCNTSSQVFLFRLYFRKIVNSLLNYPLKKLSSENFKPLCPAILQIFDLKYNSQAMLLLSSLAAFSWNSESWKASTWKAKNLIAIKLSIFTA